MYPPLQLTRDIRNTTTQNTQMYGTLLHQISFTYSRMHIYQGPPLPIDHKSKEYHYTEYVSHIGECTYTQGICTPVQSTIDVWNTASTHKFHRQQNAHIPSPPSNEPQIYGMSLDQIHLTYSRMHISLGQINHPPIDHKCMEYCYTK